MKITGVTLEDSQGLLDIYAPYVIETAVTFEYDVPTLEVFTNRIENALKSHVCLKAIDDEGVILGYAYAHAFRPQKAYDHCVEVTIYIKKDDRRKGIGEALYLELERQLITKGYTNLYACVAIGDDEYLTNDSSHFHTKMGYKALGTFSRCGKKFGNVYDMVWFEKRLDGRQI